MNGDRCAQWGYVVKLYVDGEEVDPCAVPDGWHVFRLDDVPVDAVPEPTLGEGSMVIGTDSVLDDVPPGILGSWDVAFSLPTYVDADAYWYPGEAWSHPKEPQRVIADDPMVMF